MNRYLAPLLALLLLAAAPLAAALHLRSETGRLRNRIHQLDTNAAAAEAAVASLDACVAARREQDRAQAAFLSEWSPHFPQAGAGQDPMETVRPRLQQEASLLPVATSAWTLPPVEETVLDSHVFRSQPVKVRVAGELTRVLTWLGRSEELFPAAKFRAAELGTFGSGVALELTIHFPLCAPARATPPARSP